MTSQEVRLIRSLATIGGPVHWEVADLEGLEHCPHDPTCPGLIDDLLSVIRGTASVPAEDPLEAR